jgi:TRAP-type uncharacterized transport system substrate-binding protein
MFSQRALHRALWLWVAPLVGLSALAVALFLYWHAPRQARYRLRMTSGETVGTRHELAQVLRRHAAHDGITIEIEATAGSEAALDAVNSGLLDAALVQGSLRLERRPHVRQVATLHVEPLHLLVKKELAAAVTSNLSALEGHSVNLGEVGSGTHSLAVDVLDFAGLQALSDARPKGYIPTTWKAQKLIAEKERARLPDAVFLVASLPSEVAKTLVARHDYRLVPMAFAEAFALDALASQDVDSARSTPDRVEKHRVLATTIPAFTYQVEPPVPPTPVPALGTRLLLVAHQDVDPHAIRQLVETVYFTEFISVLRPPSDVKLLDKPPEFPWHTGTRDFLERNTPIVSGALMDATHKGLAILAAAVSGLFVLWQWRRMRSRYLGGLRSYVGSVVLIEDHARQVERDQMGGLQHLVELRDELARLKTEAIERFSRGELADAELLLQAFIIQINDVRDYLTRLIDRYGEKSRVEDSGALLPR